MDERLRFVARLLDGEAARAGSRLPNMSNTSAAPEEVARSATPG